MKHAGLFTEIREQLQKNYDTFCLYAKLHAAKDTDEGSQKAHRNLDLAQETRATIKKLDAFMAEIPEEPKPQNRENSFAFWQADREKYHNECVEMLNNAMKEITNKTPE